MTIKNKQTVRMYDISKTKNALSKLSKIYFFENKTLAHEQFEKLTTIGLLEKFNLDNILRPDVMVFEIYYSMREIEC